MKHPDFRLLDSIPSPVIGVTTEGIVDFFNREASLFSALFYKTIVPGESLLSAILPGNRDQVERILRSAITSRVNTFDEVKCENAKGKPFNLEIIVNPPPKTGKSSDLVYIIINEISNERIFQKKASQLVNDISSLIEHANAVIFGVDSQEYITDWNKACCQFTGYIKEDVFAKKIYDVIDEEFQSDFRNLLNDALSQRPTGNFELKFKTESAEPLIALMNATPRINSLGIVIGVLFVGHDVTELFTYRKSLERIIAEKTEKLTESLAKEKELVEIKNRFVSMASHEFRIPLSNIRSSLSFISKHNKIDNASVEKAKDIEVQLGHMQSLIDDVLAVGKTDANKLKPTVRKFNLIDFLNKIINEVAVNAKFTHQIVFETSHASIEIESDEKLLRNIFLNLLSNAIKFSPGQPSVSLRVKLHEAKLVAVITDDGVGITESDLGRVFEPFNRGSNVSGIKGTGLGLSITKRAVEALGGIIHVTSVVNKGTEITVTLNI